MVFRGHADATWCLSSTLERDAEMYGFQLMGAHEIERENVEEFQRHACQYLTAPPRPDSNLEWLALIQHHGGATRLLDFSDSFYVAAFFAVEMASADAAVWCIDGHSIRNSLKEEIDPTKDGKGHQAFEKAAYRLVERSLCAPSDPGFRKVIAVRPWRLSDRMTAQRGLFLCPTDLETPFEQNLEETLDLRKGRLKSLVSEMTSDELQSLARYCPPACSVIKVILSREILPEIRSDLRRMNITAATLFPGLDGFARSLRAPLKRFHCCDA